MKLKQCIQYNNWTKWFAWHPIKTTTWERIWLEKVERRLFLDNKIDILTYTEKQYKRINNIK